MNNIYLPINGVYRKFSIDDILYAKSQDNYVILYFINTTEKIKLRITMKDLVDVLHDQPFSRCHRQYTINEAYIETFDYSKMEVKLTNGCKIPVSRSRKNDLLDNLHLLG